jgi:hypothetical protein
MPYKLAGIFAAAFILAQLTIPLFQLTQPRPARFGWQMYSTVPVGSLGGVFVVDWGAGGVDTVKVADHVARVRPEMDYRRLLPPYLCQKNRSAAAIRFDRPGSYPERHVCP